MSEDLFNKNIFNLDDIDTIISNGYEESQYLEFKEKRAFEIKDLRSEISKDISAFANSTGGIIIYGIEEKNSKGYRLSFIDGDKFTKEWLQQVISSNIQRRISGIQIFPIRYNNNLKETIYVVKIPESIDSPHQALDKKFYKRDNTECIPMHEYEIRNIYNRAIKTHLEIEKIEIKNPSISGSIERYSNVAYSFYVNVRNIGNILEKYFKVEIMISKNLNPGITQTNEVTKREEDSTYVFTISNTSPLFQNQTWLTQPIVIRINRDFFLNPIENRIKIYLYFSSGREEKTYDISNEIIHKGRLLTINDFLE